MLTDLEIRKAISMIGLVSQFPLAKSIEFDNTQNCYWVENVGFTSWPLLNPLEDDALCFQLMVEHGIELKYTACPAGSGSLYFANTPSGMSSDYCESPNKAISLATIKAYDITSK